MIGSFFRHIIFAALLLSPLVSSAQEGFDAVSRAKARINDTVLVISSYNPDSKNSTGTITSFIDKLASIDLETRVVIENMNCLSFSSAASWTVKMNHILLKYAKSPPSLILLLGQEA